MTITFSQPMDAKTEFCGKTFEVTNVINHDNKNFPENSSVYYYFTFKGKEYQAINRPNSQKPTHMVVSMKDSSRAKARGFNNFSIK